MKSIYIILASALLMISSVSVYAQQDALYTQYLFNGLAINPAYAGARESISATLLARQQWVDIDGAPSTQTLSVHSPLKNEKIALGGMIYRDAIGPLNRYGLFGMYAYRLPLEKGKLSFGLQGGLHYNRVKYEDLDGAANGDQVFSPTDNSKNEFLPNVGAGIYYQSKRLAAGLSAPHLLNKDMDLGDNRQSNHYFATLGYIIPLSSKIAFKPYTLVKYVHGGRMQLDLSGHFIFMNSLWLGGTYRTDGTGAVMIEYALKKDQALGYSRFMLGYAYDFANKRIREVSGGSHEVILTYEFLRDKTKILSPRTF